MTDNRHPSSRQDYSRYVPNANDASNGYRHVSACPEFGNHLRLPVSVWGRDAGELFCKMVK